MFRKAQNQTITVKLFNWRLEETYFIIIWCFPLDDKVTDHYFAISYTFLPFPKSQFKKNIITGSILLLDTNENMLFSGYFHLLLGKTLNEMEWQEFYVLNNKVSILYQALLKWQFKVGVSRRGFWFFLLMCHWSISEGNSFAWSYPCMLHQYSAALFLSVQNSLG